MRTWLRWRPTKTQVIVVASILVLVAFVGAVVWTNGTGFGEYPTISTTTQASSAPGAPTITTTEQYQRGKTLWDWMQLLIVPVVLAVGGFIFNRTERQLEQRRAEERADLERKHADERAQLEQCRAEERAQLEQQRTEEAQREAALQTYLDQMADVLLKGLRSSEPGSELRDIARIRTLTTLRRLDSARWHPFAT